MRVQVKGQRVLVTMGTFLCLVYPRMSWCLTFRSKILRLLSELLHWAGGTRLPRWAKQALDSLDRGSALLCSEQCNNASTFFHWQRLDVAGDKGCTNSIHQTVESVSCVYAPHSTQRWLSPPLPPFSLAATGKTTPCSPLPSVEPKAPSCQRPGVWAGWGQVNNSLVSRRVTFVCCSFTPVGVHPRTNKRL